MAEYVERTALRDALYDSDAITMQGVNILNQFPAADVAPVVHGEWAETVYSLHDAHADEYFDEVHYTCTVCECEVELKTPYCPDCGAKMDGESGE